MNLKHVKTGARPYRFVNKKFEKQCNVCWELVKINECIVGLGQFRSHKQCEDGLAVLYEKSREVSRNNGKMKQVFTMDQAREIRRKSADQSATALAKEYDVSYTTIANLLRGETYRET